jgi:hypothetical protein
VDLGYRVVARIKGDMKAVSILKGVQTGSPNFGRVRVYNPNNLNVVNDGFVLQDIFYNVILQDLGAG